MAIDKNKVKQLLGTGLTPEVVANAVGCEPSYVSQLLSDEVFASEVANLRSAALVANTRRDDIMGQIEEDLLLKLKETIPLIYKPRDVLHAVAVVNNMKRRGASAPGQVHVHQTVVELQLPVAARAKFVKTIKGEVIEADGQTLVSMPAHTLLNKLAANKGTDSNDGEKDKYLRAGRFVAGGA